MPPFIYMTYEVYRGRILENNLPLGYGPFVDLSGWFSWRWNNSFVHISPRF